MNITTFEATITNGLVRFDQESDIPEKTKVFVVVPEFEEVPQRNKFDLAELVSRMPAEYQTAEFDFGKPVGKEEW